MEIMTAQNRVHIGKQAPALYASLLELNAGADAEAVRLGLGRALIELVNIRASQINGCGFCLEIHARKALAAGENPDRLAVLPAWAETTFFTERERHALALTEAITLIADARVPDEVYDAARAVFSDDEIAAVSWVAVVINTFNRVAISSRFAVGPVEAH